MLDLDRYYTPDGVADQLLERAASVNPNCCADSACGNGSLLFAASRVFPKVACVGVDNDRVAIQRLRRRRPDWYLSFADVLNPATYARAKALASMPECNLLTLNPPFSMNGKKRVNVNYSGKQLHGSVAMAHILRSLDLFSPTSGAVAIVPESLLYSEVDEIARGALGANYKIETVLELRNTTFRGARANAVVIRLTPVSNVTEETRDVNCGSFPKMIQLIRGGLPMFELVPCPSGIPLVHSTDIAKVMTDRTSAACRTVRRINRGVVSGAVILLPRVGVPKRSLVFPVYLRSRVQLSDCVIAMKFPTMAAAREFMTVLEVRWQQFSGLYRGTGARYITISRLSTWLSDVSK